MSKRKSYIIIIILFLITTLLLVTYQLYQKYYRLSWIPSNIAETNQPLPNPNRGWYNIYGYTLSDESNYTVDQILESSAYDIDSQLAMLQINLKNYPLSKLSDAALLQLDLIFSAWEQTNKKLIVRFLYDWDGKALETEPENLSLIQTHMTQTAEVLNKYISLIYTLQGIYVGNCGEMNGTNYMTEAAMMSLINHLASVTDPSIFLSVRTPAHWRQISSSFVPLTKAEGFSPLLSARIGLYNDGMLGSVTDYGTYGELPLSQAIYYSDKGNREDELIFQNQLCLYVPNGGEVIVENPYNDLNAAIRDLSKMHVSYLNSMYDPQVLDKWKATIYEGEDIFDGCTGYEYISNHLGYRYLLAGSKLDFHTFKDEMASLTLHIKNRGFANSYQRFKVQVSCINTLTKDQKTLSIDTDTRYWLPGEVSQLTLPLDIRTYGEGNYELYLSITDPTTNKPILLANEGRNIYFGYPLGTLAVRKFAQE